MTATLFFIRHAAHGHIGNTLSGRQPGLSLTDSGRDQAEALGERVASVRFAAIHASPRRRARETAEAIRAAQGAGEVEVVEALDEIDFGEWTGRSFAELDGDDGWQQWNAARGTARCPGGETMAEAQARAVSHAEAAAAAHPGRKVALVSHCDVIRGALAYWLGLSLDHVLRFDVDPASVSRVAVGPWGGRVLSINEQVQ